MENIEHGFHCPLDPKVAVPYNFNNLFFPGVAAFLVAALIKLPSIFVMISAIRGTAAASL